jgi:hypothetical protein
MSDFMRRVIAGHERRIAHRKAEVEATERLIELVRSYMTADPSLRLGGAIKLAQDELEREGSRGEGEAVSRDIIALGEMLRAVRGGDDPGPQPEATWLQPLSRSGRRPRPAR